MIYIIEARRGLRARGVECKEASRIKCVIHVEKLELRFLHTKKNFF